MTEDDHTRGRWEGEIETTQKNLERRINRIEGVIYAVVAALITLGAKSLGIWF